MFEGDCYGDIYYAEDYKVEYDAISMRENAAQKMMVLRPLCNNGIKKNRQFEFNCDEEVDKILKLLRENGFTFIEAEYFFEFAKARLENSLLYQPLRKIEKYPAEDYEE